jgi:general secretion pathway protein C
LNTHLWGTITGKDGTAYAVIESPQPQNRRSEQHLFKEGQKVLNAEIEKVYRDKVVLNLEGEQQVLEMEKYQSRASSRRSIRPMRQPVSLTRTIRRNEIEESFQNINTIMRQAVIRPRSDGMLVSRIKPGSIFRCLGLRNGDIIQG